MGIIAAKTDKTFLLTRRSDPEQTAEQNFAAFLGVFVEPFYLLDQVQSGPKGRGDFRFSTVYLRSGVSRVQRVDASAFALSYCLKKNLYHGYVNLFLVLQGQLTINIAGSRTHQIGAGCAMLCNPAQSLLLKTGKDTVFGSILVATNWFHENCGLLSDHFAEVVIDSAMPQSRMFLSAAEAFFSNLDAIDPSES